MKKIYLEEEQIYLISNHAVARNPLFASQAIQHYFKEKIASQISPVADILSYNLVDHEFQILLKLKKKEEIINHYTSRKRYKAGDIIPKVTYIFSRAMSNLQVGLVKKFNFMYGRSGTLMASRFYREPVNNLERAKALVEQMNNGKKIHSYQGLWINKLMNKQREMTSWELYEMGGEFEDNVFQGFRNIFQANLVDQLLNPKKRYQISPIHFHFRNYINALMKNKR
jgi:hypothetical protein